VRNAHGKASSIVIRRTHRGDHRGLVTDYPSFGVWIWQRRAISDSPESVFDRRHRIDSPRIGSIPLAGPLSGGSLIT
jgi:hypothetical protein